VYKITTRKACKRAEERRAESSDLPHARRVQYDLQTGQPSTCPESTLACGSNSHQRAKRAEHVSLRGWHRCYFCFAMLPKVVHIYSTVPLPSCRQDSSRSDANDLALL
jgi:hypothetical protein